jgi:hypothetical protein
MAWQEEINRAKRKRTKLKTAREDVKRERNKETEGGN